MTSVLSGFSRRQSWLHHLGRVLVLVVQLAFVLTPLAEGREERVLGSHVEGPRTVPHPGHHADTCPACQFLSVHGRTEERSQLSELPQEATGCRVQRESRAIGAELEVVNCSRAPPVSA